MKSLERSYVILFTGSLRGGDEGSCYIPLYQWYSIDEICIVVDCPEDFQNTQQDGN